MKDFTSELHKEIDLVQSVIQRMAGNSFLLKGWMVSLVVVIIAIPKDSIFADEPLVLMLLMSVPILSFWYLDAFYLHKERCYRKLYEWIVINRPDSRDNLYSLNYTRFSRDVPSVFKIMFSKTIFPFYGTVLFLVILLLGL